MEIIVEPKDGKPAFYFQKLEQEELVESVTTNQCFRCFAGMLVMNRKKDADETYPKAGVYIWHIPPGCRNYVR